MVKIILSLVALLILAAAIYWWARLKTYHLATVQEGVLYRDGNRGLGGVENACRKGKPRTIVLRVDDAELASREKPEFASEMTWCQQQGIRVERIPISLGG